MLAADESDYDDYAVDMTNSSFHTSSEVAVVNSHIPMTLYYHIPDSIYSSLADQSIIITFTQSLELLENSVTLNGNTITDYGYWDNVLTIDATEKSGTIQFYVTPIEAGTIAAYAQFHYTRNSSEKTDTIGIVYLDAPLLKLNVPSQTSQGSFYVTGVTTASETVLLSINGTQVESVKSKMDGTFSTEVSIPDSLVSGTSYTVTGKLQSDASVVSSGTIVYQEGAPTLTQFDMYYYGPDLKKLDLLNTDGTRLTNSIYPNHPFRFEVKFENYDNIGKVFIASTKSGITNKMQALTTSTPGEYIAEGYFEGTDTSYIPGTINVLYTTKGTIENYTADLAPDQIPTEWKDATIEVLSSSSEEYKANIILSESDHVVFETHENVSLSELRAELLSNEQPLRIRGSMKSASLMALEGEDWEAVLSFFEDLKEEYKDNVMSNAEELHKTDQEQDVAIVIKDDLKDRIIYVFWDSAKEAFYTAGVKFLGTNWIYENSIGVSWADSAAAWGFIANSANVIIHTYNDIVNLEAVEADIKSSNLTSEQKEYALKKAEQLRWGYAATNFLRLAATVSGYALSATGHPLVGTLVSTILNTAANLADNYLNNALAYYAAGGQGTYLKWLIDPSGYVYDVDSNQKIEGVTVTAYWIPYDEEDADFWNKPPTLSQYGTLWDASEYSQQNPLSTDAEGNYAWEVPEGWWRVKYEKDGYETIWSDWMTVPPVQTDVNIGMTSTILENYSVMYVSATATSTTVSLTNNTSSVSSIVFIVAAYNGNGKMIATKTMEKDMAVSESINLTVSYKATDNASVVKAFVVQKGTMTPLREAWTKEMAA